MWCGVDIWAVTAAMTAAQRLKGMAGTLPLCFWSIAAGAGTVIAVMLATRSLQPDISMLGSADRLYRHSTTTCRPRTI